MCHHVRRALSGPGRFSAVHLEPIWHDTATFRTLARAMNVAWHTPVLNHQRTYSRPDVAAAPERTPYEEGSCRGFQQDPAAQARARQAEPPARPPGGPATA